MVEHQLLGSNVARRRWARQRGGRKTHVVRDAPGGIALLALLALLVLVLLVLVLLVLVR